MKTIHNPVLRGFNPDPSILRVGDDYYIATSTFEWFPGVQIHHSRDLRHWRLAARPLERRSQLDMLGNPDSGGIWAPCLSYADGLFHLVFTDVKSHVGPFKDTHNYLVTAPSIEGPWSEPIYLNSSGFDPSLFHDDDGRKWLVNMIWDYRKGKNKFAGIALQEYSPEQKRLVGPIRN
ncbi:MAG: glycoside hydrolase 43 family protein, partial [Paenibacillaceae bacterium]